MLVRSNACIFGGFSIFGNTFNASFWGFPQVRNPYKRLQGNGFFCASGWFRVFGGCVWLDAIEWYQYHAFLIATGLNVMFTGVGRRLQGMRWSMLICIWRDIFEP